MLTLETGTVITNNGVLEAINGGTLQIEDAVIGSGSGSGLIAGGTLIFGSTSTINVTFDNQRNIRQRQRHANIWRARASRCREIL